MVWEFVQLMYGSLGSLKLPMVVLMVDKVVVVVFEFVVEFVPMFVFLFL